MSAEADAHQAATKEDSADRDCVHLVNLASRFDLDWIEPLRHYA